MSCSARLIGIAVAIALLGTALLGCQGNSSSNPFEFVPTTASVTRSKITEVINLSGQVTPLDSRELRFETVGGRVEEVLVEPGQVVGAGDALIRLDTSELERNLREAEADLVVAEAQVAEAETSVSPAQVALAKAELATAEYQLAAATLELDLTTAAGLTPLEEAVADKQAALQVAQDSLVLQELTASQTQIRDLEYQQAFFQRALRDLKPGEDSAELERAIKSVEHNLANTRAAREETLARERDAVAKAEEDLEMAQSALERTRSGEFDPVIEHRLAYERALASREKAQARLEELTVGTDSEAVEQARTIHEAAIAKVESAQADIEAATLKAPIDGVVFDVYERPNSWVNPSDVVVYLADPSELHIKAQASDVDVVHLSVGQQVRVSFMANPTQFTVGKVISVAERGQTMDGMVTYEVEAVLEEAFAYVLPGMMATMRVLIGERDDVLSVPAAAIQYNRRMEPIVSVQTADGEWQDQPVQLGMNDGIMVEVLSGLEEGQTIAMPVFSPWTPDQGGMPPEVMEEMPTPVQSSEE